MDSNSSAKKKAILFLLTDTPRYQLDKICVRTKWVHPINQAREKYGEFHHLLKELKKDDERFLSYFRMTFSMFTIVLNLIEEDIKKMNIGYREAITPAERLALTLR